MAIEVYLSKQKECVTPLRADGVIPFELSRKYDGIKICPCALREQQSWGIYELNITQSKIDRACAVTVICLGMYWCGGLFTQQSVVLQAAQLLCKSSFISPAARARPLQCASAIYRPVQQPSNLCSIANNVEKGIRGEILTVKSWGLFFYEILQKSNSYIAEVMEGRKDTCSDSELSSPHLPNVSFAVPLPLLLSLLSVSLPLVLPGTRSPSLLITVLCDLYHSSKRLAELQKLNKLF